MLVTHWGLSGPAILRLSAWGARDLFSSGYKGKEVLRLFFSLVIIFLHVLQNINLIIYDNVMFWMQGWLLWILYPICI